MESIWVVESARGCSSGVGDSLSHEVEGLSQLLVRAAGSCSSDTSSEFIL